MVTVLAGTEMPHSFYGDLTINGIPAQVGTEIRAVTETGIDITYNPPHMTDAVGEYGKGYPNYPYFSARASSGTILYFMVELSPGSGNFAQADQSYIINPGEITEMNLTVIGETPPPPPQEGQAALSVTNQPPTVANIGDNINVGFSVSNVGGDDAVFVHGIPSIQGGLHNKEMYLSGLNEQINTSAMPSKWLYNSTYETCSWSQISSDGHEYNIFIEFKNISNNPPISTTQLVFQKWISDDSAIEVKKIPEDIAIDSLTALYNKPAYEINREIMTTDSQKNLNYKITMPNEQLDITIKAGHEE